MSQTAFILTLASAVLHAYWNFLLKRARDKPSVMFGSGYIAVALGLPLYLILGNPRALLGAAGVCIVLSGAIHYAYRALLAATYEKAELSQSYPVARSAPILVAILAVLFLDEELKPWGWAGIALTVAGIYVLHAREFASFRKSPGALRGLAWAAATMVSVAAYSIVDKLGVAGGRIHPAEYFYCYNTLTMLLYSSTLAGWRARVLKRAWRKEYGRMLGIGLFEPFSYVLILLAFRTAMVSYVVSVRQLSVVLAAAMGIVLLKERAGAFKILGAVLVVAGVALLRAAG